MRACGSKIGRLGVCFFLLASLVLPASAGAAEVLRFGILPVVDTLPLLVAQEKGFFTGQGISLQTISFQSALERDAALQAGNLDGYFGDILNTVLLIHSGQQLKIITTCFHTNPRFRMFGVVAAPSLKVRSLEELRGKQVAISRATIIEYLLDKILQKNGLPADFVKKQEIKNIPIRLQMLLADKVDAALLPEPLLTLAESKGARVVADDRDLDMALTVLAVRSSLIKRSPTVVQRFLIAYRQGVREINRNPEKFKDLLVRRTRFPQSIRDSYRIPEFPPVSLPLPGDVAATQVWLQHKAMVKQLLPYEMIVGGSK
ncbi:MAG: ABC transporter substrate-binding protein [Deltaproteobacteria bacterium]|nr:ABC transporter substrate-binding protein [Deltaproteobacteria bacterium]MBW2071993.1 ABC transporter substrate-binding protein [Deltaproteobacteria bacterium]